MDDEEEKALVSPTKLTDSAGLFGVLDASDDYFFEPALKLPLRWRLLRSLHSEVSISNTRKRSHKLWKTRRRFRQFLIIVVVTVLVVLPILINVRKARIRRQQQALRPSTLAFSQWDLRRVWEWEITSGHYPTRREVPEQFGIKNRPKISARRYLDVQSHAPYARRPPLGSAADLDLIFDACDFSAEKYARDCLEFLKSGGGLGGHSRVSDRYIFSEEHGRRATRAHPEKESLELNQTLRLHAIDKKRIEETPYGQCDPEHPRIFHTYWVGPITDKAYVTLLSFFYTQNLGLHLSKNESSSDACQPQMWVWMDLNPAIPMPAPNASIILKDMLESNMWSEPFLHSRFRRHLQFKLWNATEQLDAISEVKDDWRNYSLLVSQGRELNPNYDEKFIGAVSSDLARFVLLQRYGGIYVDGDMIFLRDWEELWGWQGAFSYRWSIHDNYNTAILRMHKNSALGSFILRTAVRNGWDFHPVAISWYMRDANSSDLLYRLPDALFDPIWLHTEGRQRDKPPTPVFDRFESFSNVTASKPPSGPHPFNEFFRGAFGYHSHLTRSSPFDPTRNWPDLRPRYDDEIGTPEHGIPWSAALKRTFESYIRGNQPNMYGESIRYDGSRV